jgi:hypothetical protein
LKRRALLQGSFAGLATTILPPCSGLTKLEASDTRTSGVQSPSIPTHQTNAQARQNPFVSTKLQDPTWIPAPGEIARLQTTNSFMELREGALPDWDHRFGTIIDDFSGGVYNAYWGELGAMVFHGGGHASTYDNSVLILDYNDLTFKRLSHSSKQSSFNHMHGDPLFNRPVCEYGDGQPAAGHTYDTLAILPPGDGGAPAGSLIRVSSHAAHTAISCSTTWSHRFDMNARMSDGRWTRWSVNGPTNYRAPGACSAYDPQRKRFWWIANLSSLPPFIRYLDVESREQREIAYARGAQLAPPAQPNSMTMRYDSLRDLLLVSCTVSGVLRVAYMRCEDPASGWVTPTLSSQIPSRKGWSHSFDHVPEIDQFVMLAPADEAAVYEFAIPRTLSSPWAVTRRSFRTRMKIPVAHVTGKRWSYAPAVKSFVWVARSSGPAVVYRPIGT